MASEIIFRPRRFIFLSVSNCQPPPKSVKLLLRMKYKLAHLRKMTLLHFSFRILFLFLLIAPAKTFSATAPDWENQHILHINTEPPRATFVPFPNMADALGGQFTNSPFYFSLNGRWKFHWSPKPELRPTYFFQATFDDSDWSNIDVPSNG